MKNTIIPLMIKMQSLLLLLDGLGDIITDMFNFQIMLILRKF